LEAVELVELHLPKLLEEMAIIHSLLQLLRVVAVEVALVLPTLLLKQEDLAVLVAVQDIKELLAVPQEDQEIHHIGRLLKALMEEHNKEPHQITSLVGVVVLVRLEIRMVKVLVVMAFLLLFLVRQ
jgi:hypothetical protein